MSSQSGRCFAGRWATVFFLCVAILNPITVLPIEYALAPKSIFGNNDDKVAHLIQRLQENPSDQAMRDELLQAVLLSNAESVYLQVIRALEQMRVQHRGDRGLTQLQVNMLYGLSDIYAKRGDTDNVLFAQAAIFARVPSRADKFVILETIASQLAQGGDVERVTMCTEFQSFPPSDEKGSRELLQKLRLDPDRIVNRAMTSHTSPMDRAGELLKKARLAESENDFSGALTYCREAVKEDPNSVEALTQLSNSLISAYFEIDHDEDLLWENAEVLQQMVKRAPDNPDVLKALGDFYGSIHDEIMAARIAYTMLRKCPEHPGTYKILLYISDWWSFSDKKMPAKVTDALLAGLAISCEHAQDAEVRARILTVMARVYALGGRKNDKPLVKDAGALSRNTNISAAEATDFLNRAIKPARRSIGKEQEEMVVNSMEDVYPDMEVPELARDVYALVFGMPTETMTLSELVACGDEALAQMKFYVAAEFFLRAAAMSPDDLSLRKKVLRCLVESYRQVDQTGQAGRINTIRSVLINLLAKDPHDAEVAALAARMYLTTEQPDMAVHLLYFLFRQHPGQEEIAQILNELEWKIASTARSEDREKLPTCWEQLLVCSAIQLVGARDNSDRYEYLFRIENLLNRLGRHDDVLYLKMILGGGLPITANVVNTILARLNLPIHRQELVQRLSGNDMIGALPPVLPTVDIPEVNVLIYTIILDPVTPMAIAREQVLEAIVTALQGDRVGAATDLVLFLSTQSDDSAVLRSIAQVLMQKIGLLPREESLRTFAKLRELLESCL